MATSTRRQVQTIERNVRQVMRQKIPQRINRALTGVGVVVGNKSLEYTPVEFSMLVNSQYRRLDAYPNRYTVSVGYTAEYAAALHNRTDWSPRAPENKQGPAWNPNASPKFLLRAADETRAMQTRILLGDLKL